MFRAAFALAACVAIAALTLTTGAAASITRLTTAAGFDGESVFSPDGTRIAFASERRLQAVGAGRDLFTVTRDGLVETNVTCPATNPACTVPGGAPQTLVIWPQWTDNGKVVYSTGDGIAQIGTDGNGLHTVFSGVANFPHVLSTGRVAFLGDTGIGTVNQDGTAPATLVDGEGYPLNLSFASSTIAYTSRADGSLRLVNADGTGDTQVTTFSSLYSAPSPDGSKVAFVHYDPGTAQHDLFVINRDGTGLTQLTNDMSIENETMSWSPNGRHIAFYRSTNPDGSANDVVVANARGNGTQEFGTALSDDLYPRYAPDGEAITFTSDYGETANYDVFTADVADLESASVGAGGTVTTTTPAGPSAIDPVQTSVTTPVAGTVVIREGAAGVTPPTGYEFGPEQVDITAPQATVVLPLRLVFRLAASAMPTGTNASTLVIFRDGVQVGPCLTGTGTAVPDPCVSSRQALSGGGAEIAVLSSHASAWNFGAHAGFAFEGFFAPVDNLPTTNVTWAGLSIPVKFSLHGNQGLAIFAAGYPTSRRILCNPLAPSDFIESIVAPWHKPLTYDAATDRYTSVFRTDPDWSGTCRQLVLKLTDGSFHRANFRFR
ncbi:MAG: PxKF domain-containing protein [Actinomycetota bacterium]|nr:PxKF domain-containing protein [Actinomycetota bacterium]